MDASLAADVITQIFITRYLERVVYHNTKGKKKRASQQEGGGRLNGSACT